MEDTELLAGELDTLRKKIDDGDKALLDQVAKTKEAEEQLEEMKVSKAELGLRLREKERSLASAEEKLKTAEQALFEAEKELQQAGSDVANALKERDSLATENDVLRQTVEELEQEMEAHRQAAVRRGDLPFSDDIEEGDEAFRESRPLSDDSEYTDDGRSAPMDTIPEAREEEEEALREEETLQAKTAPWESLEHNAAAGSGERDTEHEEEEDDDEEEDLPFVDAPRPAIVNPRAMSSMLDGLFSGKNLEVRLYCLVFTNDSL